jgi:VanZ family protein
MRLNSNFWPAIIWWLIVTYCSLTVAPQLPDFNLFTADKLIHFGIYGLLCLLILGGFRFSGKMLTLKVVIFAVAISAIWGAILETCQAYLPYRTYELDDMVANTIGACLAPPLYWLVRKMNPRF